MPTPSAASSNASDSDIQLRPACEFDQNALSVGGGCLGNSLGVLNTSRDADFSKTLLVVTIELESAENV